MKKRVRKVAGVIFLALAIAISQVPPSFAEAIATAGEFQKDGNTLISYTGTASVVSVPDDIKKIATDAFAGNYYLEEVKIPSGVEVIENGAFRDCKRLKEVYLPEGLEKIESGAFSMCPKLSYVKFSSTIMDIGAGVFAGDKSLSKIDIGKNSYFVLQDGALYNRDRSKLIQVFAGRIGTFFDMPDTVINIERYAFWGCGNLEEIELSSNLYEIPEYSFSNCSNLENISFPHSVRKISAKAFEDCICMKNITLPVSVTAIHPTAFDGCYDLKISAQEGTAAYEFAKAFEETKLLLLEQEGSTISRNSIGGSYSEVNEEPDEQQEDEDDPVKEKPDVYDPANPSDVSKLNVSDYYATDSEDLLGKTRVVNGNAVVLYDEKQETVLDADAVKQPEFVPDFIAPDEGDHLISKKKYYQATEIKKATIEPSVLLIDDFAFARSTLTDVVIPEGVTHIGYGAFYHCDNLSKVQIPSSVETIEPEAFSQTGYLENWKQQPGDDFLIVGDGILLAYKGNAARVYIPENVKKIAGGVFANHSEIVEVTFGNLLTEIGEDAFNGCTSLNVIHWGSGIQKIADRAFALCPLSKVTIPYSVTQIGLAAFKNAADGAVVFENQDVLPNISYEKTATRIENASMRELTFPSSSVAVIKDADVKIQDSLLDVKSLGFRGIVLEIKDFDSSQAKLVYSTKLPNATTGLVDIPKTVRVNGKSYDISSALPDALDAYETYDVWGDEKLKGIILPPALGKVEDYHSELAFEDETLNEEREDETQATENKEDIETQETGTGVTTIVRSSDYSDAGEMIAEVLDDDNKYLLYVDKNPISQTALVTLAEKEYGPLLQGQITVLDLTMVERKTNVPITNFGNTLVEIWLPISETLASQNICALTLDESGKLSTIYGTKQRKDDKNYFVFRTKHFSPYGLYAGIGEHGEKIKMESQKLLQKDVSPQTGDFFYSKWIIVALSLLLGIALSIGIPLKSAK